MTINGCRAALGAVTCSLLLGSAFAAAAEEDTFEQRKETAEQRLEMAKDSCKRLQKEAREQCEKKAEADYTREVESIRQLQSPSDMGRDPGGPMEGGGIDQEME